MSYSRAEVRAVGQYYWHLRERGLSSGFLPRMCDFSKCYDMLDLDEKRKLFMALWIEDGSNVNYILDYFVDFLNGKDA